MFQTPVIIVALMLCMTVRVPTPLGQLASLFEVVPPETDAPDQDEDSMPGPESDGRVEAKLCRRADFAHVRFTFPCPWMNHSAATSFAGDSIYALKQLRI